jgi:branched-chain amino acid transport system substrate-binding protein
LELLVRYLISLLVFMLFAPVLKAEIVIGVAGPLSGQYAVYGNELRSGVTAAVSAINANGGINGESLTVIEGDDACDAKRAVEVAKTFVSKDVRLVVGHFCTSASLAAAPTYTAANILMFNPAVTSPELTSKNLWNVFRLTGRDDAQGEIAANRIKAEGQGSEVVLLTDGQIETVAIVKTFQAALPNSKLVTLKAGSIKLPDDPGLIIASAFYLALQPIDAAEAVKAIRQLNLSASFYGPDLLQSESFASRSEAAGTGTKVSFLRDNITVANPQKLASLASSEGATLAAYAAVETFAAAAKARSVNDSRAMANWLTTGNEALTIIGPLRFDAAGDLQQQPYIWYTWSGTNLIPE